MLFLPSAFSISRACVLLLPPTLGDLLWHRKLKLVYLTSFDYECEHLNKILQGELHELVLQELLYDCLDACYSTGVCCLMFTTVVPEHWIRSSWLTTENIHTMKASSS